MFFLVFLCTSGLPVPGGQRAGEGVAGAGVGGRHLVGDERGGGAQHQVKAGKGGRNDLQNFNFLFLC